MAFFCLKKTAQIDDPEVICGMDEVGRGPWAGPVVACALMFKRKFIIKGLKDSKGLSAEKREEFYEKLKKVTWFGIGMAEHDEIDKFGLTKATNKAFERALEALIQNRDGEKPDLLVIDGRDKFRLPIPYKSFIKGDEKLKIIACASIMAKVERDRLMQEYAKQYPEYGFESHMGYGTKRHQQALKEHGTCNIHRKSYAPIAAIVEKNDNPHVKGKTLWRR